MGFFDQLDAALASKDPPPAPVPTAVAANPVVPVEPDTAVDASVPDDVVTAESPAGDPEPEVACDAFGVPIPVEEDPFAAILEAAMGTAVNEKPSTDVGVNYVSEHAWESQGVVEFAGEPYKYRCEKCLRWVKVPREQTLNQAITAQGINPNCSLEVVGQVTLS